MEVSSFQKLSRLRDLMNNSGIDAYLVPCKDEHHSEYVSGPFRRLQWITGFTGSNGTLVVTREEALMWTDGRYHIQAEQELDPEIFHLMKEGLPGVLGPEEWLKENLRPGEVLGVDPRVISLEESRKLESYLGPHGIKINYEIRNLVDLLWVDRPPPPSSPVWPLDCSVAGMSVEDKLDSVRAELKRCKVSAIILCALDEIAWVLNMRGSDVPYNPVFLSYLLITEKEAVLFVNERRLTREALESLSSKVTVVPYNEVEQRLREVAEKKVRFWVDPRSTSKWIHTILPSDVAHLERTSPVATLKAVKNQTERRGMALAHLRDAIAIVRFLRWIEGEVSRSELNEVEAARKLDEFRLGLDNYKGPSFETIVAWGPNAAIVHYRPQKETCATIRPEGVLLVDAGAHFLEGTTDVTRTIALGAVHEEQKVNFTRVLKGHISLASIRFPRGTTGRELDPIARRYLWEKGLDYRHGTGHGVGCFLNVHEGPQSISLKDPGVPLEDGMFLTIEPGYYKERSYGIRIENVVEVTKAQISESGYGEFLEFRPVTLVPIDRNMILISMLSEHEVSWIDVYHKTVWNALSPYLNGGELDWLRRATLPLK